MLCSRFFAKNSFLTRLIGFPENGHDKVFTSLLLLRPPRRITLFIQYFDRFRKSILLLEKFIKMVHIFFGYMSHILKDIFVKHTVCNVPIQRSFATGNTTDGSIVQSQPLCDIAILIVFLVPEELDHHRISNLLHRSTSFLCNVRCNFVQLFLQPRCSCNS